MNICLTKDFKSGQFFDLKVQSYQRLFCSHVAITTENGYTSARVQKISFHNLTSILFVVLALRMSLTISSAERSSFQAPTKRSAQPPSAFVGFVEDKVLINVSIFFIADSLSNKGLISRNNSVHNCIAVISCMFISVHKYKDFS